MKIIRIITLSQLHFTHSHEHHHSWCRQYCLSSPPFLTDETSIPFQLCPWSLISQGFPLKVLSLSNHYYYYYLLDTLHVILYHYILHITPQTFGPKGYCRRLLPSVRPSVCNTFWPNWTRITKFGPNMHLGNGTFTDKRTPKWDCPNDNSWHIWPRVTKFGTNMYLGKLLLGIVYGVSGPWPSRSFGTLILGFFTQLGDYLRVC